MTPQQKKLLLKDISQRLPYGVHCKIDGCQEAKQLSRIEVDYKNGHLLDFELGKEEGLPLQVYLSEVKPYLRPMSSMTDKEIRTCERYGFYHVGYGGFVNHRRLNEDYVQIWIGERGDKYDVDKFLDYLAGRHLDFRGLIPKGLAEEAPEGLYKLD